MLSSLNVTSKNAFLDIGQLSQNCASGRRFNPLDSKGNYSATSNSTKSQERPVPASLYQM